MFNLSAWLLLGISAGSAFAFQAGPSMYKHSPQTAPALIELESDFDSYAEGERAVLSAHLLVQPDDSDLEFFLSGQLIDPNGNIEGLKIIRLNSSEAASISNPLEVSGDYIWRVGVFLQDKKLAASMNSTVNFYSKENLWIDAQLEVETDQGIIDQLTAQRHRNDEIIARAKLELQQARKLMAEVEIGFTVLSSLANEVMSKVFGNPHFVLNSSKHRYDTGERAIFYVRTLTEFSGPDGVQEVVASGSIVPPPPLEPIELSPVRISDQEFAFTSEILEFADLGTQIFRAQIAIRSKSRADSLRSGISQAMKRESEYIALRDASSDPDTIAYYQALIEELDTLIATYEGRLHEMLVTVGSENELTFYVDPSENEPVGVTVTANDPIQVTEGDVGEVISFVLDGPPTDDVFVIVEGSDQVLLDGTDRSVTLTFNAGNYSAAQFIDVTAKDDIFVGGTVSTFLRVAVYSADSRYTNFSVADLAVEILDDDVPSVIVETFFLELEEGNPSYIIYRMALDSPPSSEVTVEVAPDGNLDVGNGPATPIQLVFNPVNWNQMQTIQVTAVDDTVDEGDHTGEITHTATGSGFEGALIDSVTVQIKDNDTRYDLVRASFNFTCGLQSDGNVACWGSNQHGQLGRGNSGGATQVPEVVNLNGPAVDIALGQHYACALLQNGQVQCWGANFDGRLGDGTTTQRNSPVTVAGISDAIDLSGSFSHNCAVESGGALKCWGNNFAGKLGDNSTTSRYSPVQVLSSGVTRVFAGHNNTCAIQNGSLWCWGDNGDALVGTGSSGPDVLVPTQATAITENVVDMNLRLQHMCYLTDQSAVRCLGAGNFGRLGNGTGFSSVVPVTPTGLGSGVTDIGYGFGNYTCVVQAAAVKCWGSVPQGQQGSTITQTEPVVENEGAGATQVSIGQTYKCAIIDNDFFCWGEGGSGQLGP